MKKAKIRDIGIVAVASIIMISACPALSIADSHVFITDCEDACVGQIFSPWVDTNNVIGWAVFYLVFQAPDGNLYSLVNYYTNGNRQEFQWGLHYLYKCKYDVGTWVLFNPHILVTDEMPKGQYTMYAVLMRPSSKPESGEYLGFDKATFTIH